MLSLSEASLKNKLRQTRPYSMRDFMSNQTEPHILVAHSGCNSTPSFSCSIYSDSLTFPRKHFPRALSLRCNFLRALNSWQLFVKIFCQPVFVRRESSCDKHLKRPRI